MTKIYLSHVRLVSLPVSWRLLLLVLVISWLPVAEMAAAPTIQTISPTGGAVGTSVTIKAVVSVFNSFSSARSVTFNGTAATFSRVDNYTLTATVPAGATTGNVVVTTNSGASNGVLFYVTPVITSLSPNKGAPGTTVTISGTSFTGTTGLYFNGLRASITSLTNTTVTALVPNGATSGNVTITAPGGTSNGVYFTVLPTISGLSTYSAAVGTSITISGTNFTGATGVSFNGTAATFTVGSNNTITATVPAGAASGNLTVTTPAGTSNGVFFSVRPVISSLSPNSGLVGASITISGTGFSGVTGVLFKGISASFSVLNSTTIRATVPTGTTSGNVTVSTTGGNSNGLMFYLTPSVNTLAPSSAPVGTLINISGTGFTGATGVTFNGKPASFSVFNDQSVQATVPSGATSGNIVITGPGGASFGVNFSVTAGIANVTPNKGPVGSTVTITGTSFSDVNAVLFNGVSAAFTVVDATTITATVPAGATNGGITLKSPAGTSPGSYFYVLPAITSLTPDRAPVGTSITISGTNFTGASGVSFNNISAVYTVVSSNKITTIVPSLATTGNVTVRISSGTSSGVMFYVQPVVSSLSASSGPVGTSITLTGTSFTGTTSVEFNGVAAAFTVVNNTSITATVPPNASTGPVTVTTAGGVSSGVPFAVTPTIASLLPARAPVGALVTLVGSALTGVTQVSFNGTPAAFTFINSTTITATVPAGATSGNVTVTTPDGNSNSRWFDVTPSLVSRNPVRNALTVDPATNLVFGFDQNLAPATAANLRVFSHQRGGQLVRGTNVGATGSAITFNPDNDLRAGETLFISVPSSVTSSTGLPLNGLVYQFTARVSAASPGTFLGTGSTANVDLEPTSSTVGDVDGDGDVDLVCATNAGQASIRLNNGAGVFAGSQSVSVGSNPFGVALGDVDADGDLDLLTANSGDVTVSLRLNDGTGNFTGSTEIVVGSNPRSVSLGDVDADGDLDLLAADSGDDFVSVRYNDGAGNFTGSTGVVVGGKPWHVALGDIDADGDLDILTANSGDTTVSVRLNDGAGNFAGATEVAVGNTPHCVALGDADADGDLDLFAANNSDNTVSVRVNNGAGNFAPVAGFMRRGTLAISELTVGGAPTSVALGDVDGDGDLDLLTANSASGTASVLQNDGSGAFTAPTDVTVGNYPQNITMADVDNDGDLDLLTTNLDDNTVSMRRNSVPVALPVELISFTAQRQPAAVQLQWQTAAEQQNAYFVVERSTTGRYFTAASAAIPSMGTSSSLQSYAWIDTKAPAGHLYYRLRQVDADGTTHFSPVASVDAQSVAGLHLFPNPAQQRARLSALPTNQLIQLFDATGRPIRTWKAQANQPTELNLAGIASGVYQLRAGAQHLRLVVQ